MAWSPDKNERDEYFLFMDYVGAHAVACVQSIHATEDLLAASVFRFLSLKNAQGNDVDEHELSLGKTLGCLARDSKYATLKTQLQALHADANFEHVDALGWFTSQFRKVTLLLRAFWK